MKKIEVSTQSFSLKELRAMPKDAPSTLIGQVTDGKHDIDIMSEAFTLVFSRDIGENARLASGVAVEVALKNEERDVWFINTYAAKQTVLENLDECYEAFREEMGDDAPEGPLEAPNLRVLSVASGEWNSAALAEEIESRGRESAKPTVVLNSFEFASLTQGRRERLARELIQLRLRFNATIVIFSHEMKWGLQPGFAGRGPLGMIAPLAANIVRILGTFEHLMGSKQAGKADVHEEQTRLRDEANAEWLRQHRRKPGSNRAKLTEEMSEERIQEELKKIQKMSYGRPSAVKEAATEHLEKKPYKVAA